MGGTVAASTKHGRLIFKACIECKAPLGPWDERACVSHRTDFRFTSIADVAAAVLERSERPLPVHDVARIARRDLGASLVRGSLTSIMGAERRFCWAGKGVYGLYRHGLLPGPRTLAGVACFILATHARPIHFDRVSFVMKWAGYRFQDQSLVNALWSHQLTTAEYDWQTRSVTGISYRFGVTDAAAVEDWLMYEGTADSSERYALLQTDWRSKLRAADRERKRRLDAGIPENGTGGD